MDNDDQPTGRLLSRREIMGLFGAASAAAAVAVGVKAQGTTTAGAAAPAPLQTPVMADCVALPAQTEGPYFVDRQLQRSDVRVDPTTGKTRDGVLLDLRFVLSRVSDAGACTILPGAVVDIWHCDAEGVYSDVEDRSFNTVGQKFLRGYQVSDANGLVQFKTIYPGWYPGRAVHIHFKIRVPGSGGRADEFTSQLYFADDLTDAVHARAPYSSKQGQRLVNARDMIFREGGAQLMLPAVARGAGYAAEYRIAMRPGAPDQSIGRGRPPRRG